MSSVTPLSLAASTSSSTPVTTASTPVSSTSSTSASSAAIEQKYDPERYIQTNAGIWMPRLLYGTAWKKGATTRLVYTALHTHGFLGVDTANQPKHYAEELVGSALQQLLTPHQDTEQTPLRSRADIFIQTKFTPVGGQDPKNIPYDPTLPLNEQVMASIQSSLKHLGVEYIDSYVLHSPLENYKDLLLVWRTMEKIYEMGLVKQLGISNCYSLELLQQLYMDSQIKPSVIQNRFYAESQYDRALRTWCSTKKIIYQSFWTLTANPHLLQHKYLKTVAKQHNKTVEQIFFRALIQMNIVPLTGTTSSMHMQQDMEVFSFKLTDQEVEEINKLIEAAA